MQAGSVLAIGGQLIKGLAGLSAGKAQKRADYRQAIEEENVGAARALQIHHEARKAIGEQIAAQGASGFLPGVGTARDAVFESQVNAAMDMLLAQREAEGKAMAYRAHGDAAARQGRYSLASSLLGAASSAYGMHDDWAQAGRGQVGST